MYFFLPSTHARVNKRLNVVDHVVHHDRDLPTDVADHVDGRLLLGCQWGQSRAHRRRAVGKVGRRAGATVQFVFFTVLRKKLKCIIILLNKPRKSLFPTYFNLSVNDSNAEPESLCV